MELAEYWSLYNGEFDRARAGIAVSDLDLMLAWLDEIRLSGKHLFVLGNGGSAASAAHWACDFGKGVNLGGNRRFKVLAPNEQVPWHTALANDVSYADALAEQLANWVGAGDLVVALSVSGNSENLVRACAAARRARARTIAIVGACRGRLAEMADLAIIIPSRDYGVVEDLHMTINHALSQFVRTRFEAEQATSEPEMPHPSVNDVDREEWQALLAGLDGAEQQLVRLRFGLEDGTRRTLQEVAARCGVSVERVRHVELKLLGLLERRS